VRIVVLGLTITSSWGNGHATTYRSLLRALHKRGHRVTFLERDVPWYAESRDLPDPPFAETILYRDLEELTGTHRGRVRSADLVIVGSYVPKGVAVARWATDAAAGVTAFYDIDTPVTLAKLERGDHEYLAPEAIPRFDLYLSFAGGRVLERLEREYGARNARPLYCSFDPDAYRPDPTSTKRWDLGYMGTYSADRQPAVERLLLEPARRLPDARFALAGPQFPDDIDWPPNLERIDHLPPAEHRSFYTRQRWTLNVTRRDMVQAGWSPSVRLFEAAGCGTPVITDSWRGLEAFFEPGRDILIAETTEECVRILRETPEEARNEIGERARARVLAAHTSDVRAAELEAYVAEAKGERVARST
jgi:spore maturation protein CgeB